MLTAIALFAGPGAMAQQTDPVSAADTNQWSRSLSEIVIRSSDETFRERITGTQMGKIDLPVTMLARVPAIAGESDIIKALQLTPGIKKGSEGSIGMYVRGGGKDENLILLDGAPVYNAGHLLGFFSVFNTNALKDVQLYKSAYPALYGGRLSSILEVNTKDGNMKDFKGSASLGLIASNITLEGPVIKDKLSFMVSGRRTYADKVMKFVPGYFYDLNAKFVYKIDARNRLYLSTYYGNDVMAVEKAGIDSLKGNYTINSGMHMGNATASMRWNHRPEQGHYVSNITAYYSGFRYSVDGSFGNNILSMQSNIKELGLKADWKWLNPGTHSIRFGVHAAQRFFHPNMVRSAGAALAEFKSGPGQKITNQEMALYMQDEITISDRWQLQAGLRVSAAAVKDKFYANPEPRLGLRYLISENNSLKLSYTRMIQYMQLISSSSLTLPTDLWYPVTARVRPGISDQVSIGYYHVLPDLGISISAEAYYKNLNHLLEYKEGALLVMNDNYEQELLQGKGNAYGLEIFAGKTTGRLSGWIGYSLSYARRSFDGLNKGKPYFARYDRRHDFSFVALLEINKKWTMNMVAQYATGSPFTGQQSQYLMPKPDLTGFEVLPVYTSRNALRLSASFRVDLDVQYKFQIGKNIKGDAHISVYNLLNRTQPYRVEKVYDETTKKTVYKQQGLFGIIPAFAVNFNL